MSYPWPYRRIATEEAFSVPEVYEALHGWAAAADPGEPDQDFWDFVFTQDTPGLRRVRRQLLDLDVERLEIMDANGVDVQVLSLTAPGVQTLPPADGTALARLANDRLAELIGKRSGRFAGLAAVAPQDPRAAAAEINRAALTGPEPMPLRLMVAVNATGPETGLQSRWYRQHRSPYAPDPPEPDETPVSCRSNVVKAQFHLVQRQAELHDQLLLSGIGS